VTDHDPHLEMPRAEVRYLRERLALYRARLYRRPTSDTSKLRELERALEGAEDRLRRAERDRP
jgi:hypothetical protein